MAHSLEARVPVPRPGRDELRARAADAAQGARPVEEGAAAQGGGAAAAAARSSTAKKRGFSIPAAAWLRGELEPFARETLSPDTLRRQGFFDPSACTRLLDEHVAGSEDWSRQLWGLLAFTLWYERHVERAPGRARVTG